LSGYRVFRDFEWPASLPEFKQFNLIYGWNGSGKTTLSSLFKALQNQTAVLEGDVQFACGGLIHKASEFGPEKTLPNVRVFESAFVRDSVFASKRVGPIYFLGKESAEKQQEIERLKKAAQATAADKRLVQADIQKADKALEEFCVQQGKIVKEALRSGGNNSYNNYNKASFLDTAKRLGALGSAKLAEKRLSEEQRDEFRTKKDAKVKEPLPVPSAVLPALSPSTASSKELLARTVVSATISELASDPTTALWVKQGLALHVQNEKHAPRCRFCDQPLLAERVRMLEGHFNDQYERLQQDADALILSLEALAKDFDTSNLPDKTALADHLATAYSSTTETFTQEAHKARRYLNALVEAVKAKKASPFKAISLMEYMGEAEVPNMAAATVAILKICELVETHNTDCANFEEMVRGARKALEEALVCDALDGFKEKQVALDALRARDTKLTQEGTATQEAIGRLEREIIEHQRPAEELNKELASYLGRSELQFKVEGTAYVITRAGQVAEHLSEGERTAIAFLYFLKSLEDKDFDLANGIVVIDDPISSLDANAIFSAFGFMRARTKTAGQLFILTHNFTFFRQVKNWFCKGEKKRHCLLMLEASIDEKGRFARLVPLDPLLRDYESDYHYLFKLVAGMVGAKSGGPLEGHYAMPNIARRLLETFLSFRYPASAAAPTGSLSALLDGVQSVDAAVKMRILRFLNVCSHFDRVGDQEHDPSILAETPKVMADVMDLIRAEDQRHYDQMVALISQGTPTDKTCRV
jgi:wobble nucleotide-excising tRNase